MKINQAIDIIGTIFLPFFFPSPLMAKAATNLGKSAIHEIVVQTTSPSFLFPELLTLLTRLERRVSAKRGVKLRFSHTFSSQHLSPFFLPFPLHGRAWQIDG